ncbi:siderophore-interacting protein [Thalassotalea profundi]|uniref:Siderophore-interacting protein n=1 Tax=Thalassotalea profundi TaxID=2036687 RepID=A0ABQ3IUF3_9GAMM|nr:siderophore-interacting protein [Thalassotalea profundi]GHE94854.1 siderophore-interacting protein [Thalassotalea profundi]
MQPTMRMTQVLEVNDLSPHMRRIVLTGSSLSDFPENKESAHVKLIFPNPNINDKKPRLGMYFGFKKWMRSYTVRSFEPQKLTLTIDFAVNDHQGLATHWALQAKAGDYLGIAGPGDTKHTDLFAETHLFFGDITALPAIASILEKLPKDAVGHAYIQIPDKRDVQQLIRPKAIKVHWLITPNKLTDDFLKGLESKGSNLNNTAIFIAAEASMVKKLKAHLNARCQFDQSKLYASAYWNQKR